LVLADNGGYSATHKPLTEGPVLQRGSNLQIKGL